MTTWNGICGTSTDDARETAAANTVNDAAIVLSSGTHWLGARFPACPIAPADTITSATLTFEITTTVRDSPDGAVVYGYDGADCPAFTTTLGQISGLARTTASTTWSGTNIGATDHNLDVLSVFNEIITNGAYTTGNAIGMMLDATGTTDLSIRAYDGSSSTCPRLTVVYTAAATTAVPVMMNQYRQRR